MKQFVLSLTLATNSSGDTTTVYYTDGPGWSTLATDTPGSTWIEGRVLDPGSIRRELFSGNKVYGAVRPSFGEIVLANSDGALDAWLGYGVDGQPIIVYWGEDGAAFPSGYTQVLKCYGHALLADFDSVRVRLRDQLVKMETPFANRAFAGTGDLEGGSDMAGRSMPRLAQIAGYTPVVLVDAAKLIYLVTSGSVLSASAASAKLYEGGVEITRSTDYSTSADLLATSPSSGQSRWYFGSGGGGPVYVRLGSVPVYDLRAYASGGNASAAVINLPSECGITGSPSAAPSAQIFVDDATTTYLDVAEECAKVGPYFFGMTRADVYQCTLFAVPGVTAAYTFTTHNARDFRRTPPDEMHAPVWRLSYNAAEAYPCQTAAAATAALRDYLARTPWYFSWSYEDTSILNKHPTAPMVAVDDRSYQVTNGTGWATTLARYEDLFMVERDFISLTAPFDADTLTLDLHDTVEVRIPRFGMSSGKKFRVISIELRLRSREIAFGLWG